MSGRSARTIRNFSLELSPDLVLPNVGQVDFHDFRKHWNFKVLEMALETFRFVQGLSRTPLFLFDVSPPDFPSILLQKLKISEIEIRKSQNPGSLTSAQNVGRSFGVLCGTACFFYVLLGARVHACRLWQ